MGKNLFVRYNVMCILIIILSNCFIGAVIMYLVVDHSKYNSMETQVDMLIRNALDEQEYGEGYTVESSLKYMFKRVCPQDNRLVLYDENKEVIYTNLEKKYIGTIDLEYFAKKMEHQNNYSSKRPIGPSNLNERCHVYGRYLGEYFPNSVAKYMVILDLENDFKGSYRYVIVQFINSLICVICFSILVLLLYTYYITMPLRQMKAVAQEYARGNFKPKVEVNTKDDIGALAQTMNSMSEAIAKFEESSRNFVSNVSHEFKTPITSIIGFVDGLIDGTIPEEKRGHYLQIISNEVKRLSNLVQSMLNISKIESGGIKPVFEPVNISNIIGRILVGFFDKIESKKLDICGMENVEDCWIQGDENLVYQIFYNLIENAIKFANEEGCISFRFIQIANARSITLRNTGEGLKQEEIDKMFDRFYKTDKSRSKDKSGFGLGLNIVLTIVRLCNWRINVKSEYGKYTEFILTFRACDSPIKRDGNELDDSVDENE